MIESGGPLAAALASLLLVFSLLLVNACGDGGAEHPRSESVDFSGPWRAAFRGREASYPLMDWFKLTPAGSAAYEDFDPSTNPAYSCIPAGLPWIYYYPYLIDLEQESDRIVFTHEYMDVIRTAVLSGPYPEGSRGLHGFSIARYEGDTLVVDTRNFHADPTGLFDTLGDERGKGIPSSAQKRVVTRYRLVEGGERLRAEISIEDPVYLEQPVRLERVWRRAHDQEILPFDCVPEVAQRPNQRSRAE